jgi:hypothetical protein
MRWRKLGLLFAPPVGLGWAVSYAALHGSGFGQTGIGVAILEAGP